MFSKNFILNHESLSVIEQFGEHMPGGFFIYKADETEELLYANKAVCGIYGCDTLEEFKAFSGFTFRGMVHPDDYEMVSASIKKTFNESRYELNILEYRIIRKADRGRDPDRDHYEQRNSGGSGAAFLPVRSGTETGIQYELCRDRLS